MEDIKQPVRRALEILKERQSYESSYAEINKIQELINRFASLDQACDLLAADLAELQGRKRENVLKEYYGKAGL